MLYVKYPAIEKKKAILEVSIKKNVKKYFKVGVEARAKSAYKRVSHFV